MFLAKPPEDAAVHALYEEGRSEEGYVMNLLPLWAWRPEVFHSFLETRKLLGSSTSLSERERAVLNAATASRRGDAYCSIAWGARLARLSDESTAGAVLQGAPAPALTTRERALTEWAKRAALAPSGTTQEDVEALHAAGFSDREIVDMTMFIAFRIAFCTVNTALGARPDRELADAAPAGVLRSVTFGRPVADRPSAEPVTAS